MSKKLVYAALIGMLAVSTFAACGNAYDPKTDPPMEDPASNPDPTTGDPGTRDELEDDRVNAR